MEEYFKHTLECPSCETRIELEVIDVDEMPVYCPMCGEDVNEEWESLSE